MPLIAEAHQKSVCSSFEQSVFLLVTTLINYCAHVYNFHSHKLCLCAGLLLHKLIAPLQCRVRICLVTGRGEGEEA